VAWDWEGAPGDVQLPAVVPPPPGAAPSRSGASAPWLLPPCSWRCQTSQYLTITTSDLDTARARVSHLLAAVMVHAGRVTSQSQASPRSCVSHVAADHRAPGADPRRALVSAHCIPYLPVNSSERRWPNRGHAISLCQ
jgi:hypothetical protein